MKSLETHTQEKLQPFPIEGVGKETRKLQDDSEYTLYRHEGVRYAFNIPSDKESGPREHVDHILPSDPVQLLGLEKEKDEAVVDAAVDRYAEALMGRMSESPEKTITDNDVEMLCVLEKSGNEAATKQLDRYAEKGREAIAAEMEKLLAT